jgi:hypothetical protein
VIIKCQLNYNEVKVTNRMDDILYIQLDFQNRNFVNKKDTNKVKNIILILKKVLNKTLY